jgi:hypothetical protein
MIGWREIAVCSTLAALCLLPACGGGGGDEDAGADDAGADVTPDETPDIVPDAPEAEAEVAEDAGAEDAPLETPDWGMPCPDPAAEFNEADPGVHMFFLVAEVFMMGQPVDTAAGGFLPAAREDFKPPETVDEIPLDTCRVAGSVAPTPECTSAADCAPEQQCNPETDASGNPIAGTGVCETERATIDVGPFTCTGFTTPQTFQYNPGQSGAYTSTADGTLPPGTLAFDTDYECLGDGSATAGLGPFRGTIHLPPQLELTAPPLTMGPMGFPLIDVDAAADLALAWTGGDGTSIMTINLTGRAGTVECRVTDDGTHTIPAELVTGVGLGDVAFFNMLEIKRERTGIACGEGLTDSEWTSTTTLILNVRKTTGTTP